MQSYQCNEPDLILTLISNVIIYYGTFICEVGYHSQESDSL